ncbi:unnamed protein product, partial [Ixodes pacificus]
MNYICSLLPQPPVRVYRAMKCQDLHAVFFRTGNSINARKKNRDTNPSRSQRSEAARTFEFDKGSAELLLLPSPAQRSHGTQAGACAQTNAQQTLELAPVTDSLVIRQSLFAACIGYRLL